MQQMSGGPIVSGIKKAIPLKISEKRLLFLDFFFSFFFRCPLLDFAAQQE